MVVRREGDGGAVVEPDHVTERFRDCTPGEFACGRSGVFAEHGVRRLVAGAELATPSAYLRRVGFRDDSGTRVRQVTAV